MDWQPSSTKPALLDQIEMVILDFDGVVADSEVISLSTLRGALAQFGAELSAGEVRARFLGKSLASIAEYADEHGTARTSDSFAEVWQRELYSQIRANLSPIPSVLPLLRHLDDAGMPFCVASSSSFERIDLALEAMGLTGRFAHVFSAQQVANGKPAPDLFLLASGQLGAAPEACLVIEDSPFGIEAARAAGMRSAGFVGGAHLQDIRQSHAAMLLEKGADVVVATHLDLLRMGLAQGVAKG